MTSLTPPRCKATRLACLRYSLSRPDLVLGFAFGSVPLFAAVGVEQHTSGCFGGTDDDLPGTISHARHQNPFNRLTETHETHLGLVRLCRYAKIEPTARRLARLQAVFASCTSALG